MRRVPRRVPRVDRPRDKIGFTTPEDAWFHGMGDEVRALLASGSFGGRPYFDQAAVLHAFDRYRTGDVNTETTTFWRIADVEFWLRRFVDAPAGR